MKKKYLQELRNDLQNELIQHKKAWQKTSVVLAGLKFALTSNITDEKILRDTKKLSKLQVQLQNELRDIHGVKSEWDLLRNVERKINYIEKMRLFRYATGVGSPTALSDSAIRDLQAEKTKLKDFQKNDLDPDVKAHVENLLQKIKSMLMGTKFVVNV